MSVTGKSYVSTHITLEADCMYCENALADFTVTEHGYTLTGVYLGRSEMNRAECVRFFGEAEIARVEKLDTVREALDREIADSATAARSESREWARAW